MTNLHTTEPVAEKAILIGIIIQEQGEQAVRDYLAELAFLTETAGAVPVRSFIQRMEAPHPKTFVGSGKLNEIVSFVKENEIDLVIFDDDLSPTQLRNLDNVLECKILDRTNLILDIFAK